MSLFITLARLCHPRDSKRRTNLCLCLAWNALLSSQYSSDHAHCVSCLQPFHHDRPPKSISKSFGVNMSERFRADLAVEFNVNSIGHRNENPAIEIVDCQGSGNQFRWEIIKVLTDRGRILALILEITAEVSDSDSCNLPSKRASAIKLPIHNWEGLYKQTEWLWDEMDEFFLPQE